MDPGQAMLYVVGWIIAALVGIAFITIPFKLHEAVEILKRIEAALKAELPKAP